MTKGQAATIRDIALKLNISISTVSRALRDLDGVSAATKKTVLEMARELNYEPNTIAQSLRSNRTHTLGIVVPDLVTHFFAASISGIQAEAFSRGYNVMICQSNEDYETERNNINTLVNSRVDGLLVSLSKNTEDYSHLAALQARGIPLVLFDRVCEGMNVSTVTVDDREGACQAVRHLLEAGYRRIAHITGPENLLITRNRLEGYTEALQAYGLPVEEELIVRTDLSPEDVAQKTRALLSLAQPPEAIFVLNDPSAIQAMLVIKQMGLKIPDDIALVGFTNEPVSALVEPSLTTVAQPAYEMGQLAARNLLKQIKHGEAFIPEKAVLKTELIVRDSSHRMAMAE